MRNALALSCSALALLAACARNYNPDPGMQPDPGKGYVLETTGATVGRDDPSRTNEPDSTLGDVATRLAGQICEREARCHAGAANTEMCMRVYLGLTALEVATWPCSPAATRARAKECIAALSAEPCEMDMATKPELCVASASCPDPSAPLIPPGAAMAAVAEAEAEREAEAATSSRTPSPSPRVRAFDRIAATEALEAVDLSACSDASGPTGPGHITVTFAPDGGVLDSQLDTGRDDSASPLAGTPRGQCIIEQFRAARIPTFDGAPVKVGKSFTIP